MLIYQSYNIHHITQKQTTQILSSIYFSRSTKCPLQLIFIWQTVHIFPKTNISESISQLQISPRQKFHHRLNITLIKSTIRHNNTHRFIQFPPIFHHIKHSFQLPSRKQPIYQFNPQIHLFSLKTTTTHITRQMRYRRIRRIQLSQRR